MTSEEEHRIIEAAQRGIACGLMHPFEWYTQAVRTAYTILPYNAAVNEEHTLVETFTAFFRETQSWPDDFIGTLTTDQFLAMVDAWYTSQQQVEEADTPTTGFMGGE